MKYEKVPNDDGNTEVEVDLTAFQSGSRAKSGSRNNSPFKTSSTEDENLVSSN